METLLPTLEFQSVLTASNNKLWGRHLPVPDWVVQSLAQEDDRRVRCTLNEHSTFQCALLPIGEQRFVITVNKKLCDQLHLKIGSQVQVRLQKDESRYGLPMPEEFAEVLAQDPEGDQLFHALTPGKIRTLLYIVGQVKHPDKRISRAMAILEHLKENGGKIDYKQLNERMKSG